MRKGASTLLFVSSTLGIDRASQALKWINRNPADENKGLDTRTFALSLLVALIVILAGAIIFVHQDRRPVPQITNPKTTRAVSPQ